MFQVINNSSDQLLLTGFLNSFWTWDIEFYKIVSD